MVAMSAREANGCFGVPVMAEPKSKVSEADSSVCLCDCVSPRHAHNSCVDVSMDVHEMLPTRPRSDGESSVKACDGGVPPCKEGEFKSMSAR